MCVRKQSKEKGRRCKKVTEREERSKPSEAGPRWETGRRGGEAGRQSTPPRKGEVRATQRTKPCAADGRVCAAASVFSAATWL